MASCAQAIVRDTPTFTHNTPSRRASSSGGNLLINILEDMTSPVTSNGSATAAGTGGAHSGSGSGREHTFVEVAKWLHLQDNVLITRDIQKSKRKKTNTDHNIHIVSLFIRSLKYWIMGISMILCLSQSRVA